MCASVEARLPGDRPLKDMLRPRMGAFLVYSHLSTHVTVVATTQESTV